VDQARGCRCGDAVGSLHEAAVGHQQKHDVLGGEVCSEHAGGVSAVDESHQSGERTGTKLLDLRGRGEVHRDEVGDATVAGLHNCDRLDVGGEPAPRVLLGHPGLDGVQVLGHRLGEHRSQQVPAGGEPPVEGRVAGASAASDLVQRRLYTLLGEHLARCIDDGRTVPGGVCSQLHDRRTYDKWGLFPS
jgi:hypothetical protein